MSENNIAAERLYLLWLMEEQILAALGGTISQEDALLQCFQCINGAAAEMTASQEEKEYLREQHIGFYAWEADLKLKQKYSPVDLDALIERAEQYLTPAQDDDDYWYYYDEYDDDDDE